MRNMCTKYRYQKIYISVMDIHVCYPEKENTLMIIFVSYRHTVWLVNMQVHVPFFGGTCIHQISSKLIWEYSKFTNRWQASEMN